MGNTCPMSCLLNKNKIYPKTSYKKNNKKLSKYKKSKIINYKKSIKHSIKHCKRKSIKTKIIPVNNMDKYRIN